jgi:hypothetical protein
MDGYRHAYYDPAAIERAFAELGLDQRSMLAPYGYLNDIRLPNDTRWTSAAAPDEASMRAAQDRSTFTWSEPLDRFAWRCRIQVVDGPGAVQPLITADSWYLPPERTERLLREVEELVVTAAFRDTPWPGRHW